MVHPQSLLQRKPISSVNALKIRQFMEKDVREKHVARLDQRSYAFSMTYFVTELSVATEIEDEPQPLCVFRFRLRPFPSRVSFAHG